MSDSDSDRLFHPRSAAAMWLGYLILAGTLLTLLVETGASDSAEQLVWAQDWRLGYGIQPPLYTWLQLISFNLFGIHLGAIIFLKELLIGLAGWLTYLSVCKMTSDRKLAILAAASLLLIPQFAYESQRNLTHSLLTTALAAATLYLIVRLALESKPVPSLYLGLGVVVGLGLLSKYNFAIFFVAACAAALTLPELRRIVLNRWMLAALVLALLIFAPHAAWLWEHVPQGLSDRMAVKLHPGADAGWLSSVLKGSMSLILLTTGFALPLVLVYGLGFLFWKVKKSPTAPADDLWRRFLSRLLGWEAVVMAVMIFGFSVTGFKSRWLQPLLFVLSPYLLLRVRERITPPLRRFVLVIAALCGIAGVLVLPLRSRVADQTGYYSSLDVPFEQLAAKLQADGFQNGLLVSDDHWIVGNLRLYFPASVLTTPAFQGPPSSDRAPLLIVWSGSEISEELKQFVERTWPGVLQKNTFKTVQLEYRHSDKPTAKYSYMIAEAGAK